MTILVWLSCLVLGPIPRFIAKGASNRLVSAYVALKQERYWRMPLRRSLSINFIFVLLDLAR